jgi:hypothetical protein
MRNHRYLSVRVCNAIVNYATRDLLMQLNQIGTDIVKLGHTIAS